MTVLRKYPAGGSPADRAYSRYAGEKWTGGSGDLTNLRDTWLRAQRRELPGGKLGIDYRVKIREIISDRPFELEQVLLDRRFDFRALVDGQQIGYRDLNNLIRDGSDRDSVRRALIEETDDLIDSGFVELVVARNRRARKAGFADFWSWRNAFYKEDLSEFLVSLDAELKGRSETRIPVPEKEESDLAAAVVFYCAHLFESNELPPVDLLLGTGNRCPPGPPGLSTLAFCPVSGSRLGLTLPFVHDNRISAGSVGTLFHELTHLFHFASVGNGGYAFAPELARDNFLYEVEALKYQHLVLSLWRRTPVTPDLEVLKDQVYVAETERLLYEMKSPTPRSLRDLVRMRIEQHYPGGDFRRSPLGASHLIRGDLAGSYWMYPAALWKAFDDIRRTVNENESLIVPGYWTEGNIQSYTRNSADLFPDRTRISESLAFNLATGNIPRRNGTDIIKALRSGGYGDLIGG